MDNVKAAHESMCQNFDTHLQQRNRIDQCLVQLRLGLHSVDGVCGTVATTNLYRNPTALAPPDEPEVLAELLNDEVEMLEHQVRMLQEKLKERDNINETISKQVFATEKAVLEEMQIQNLGEQSREIQSLEKTIRELENNLLAQNETILIMEKELVKRAEHTEENFDLYDKQLQKITLDVRDTRKELDDLKKQQRLELEQAVQLQQQRQQSADGSHPAQIKVNEYELDIDITAIGGDDDDRSSMVSLTEADVASQAIATRVQLEQDIEKLKQEVFAMEQEDEEREQSMRSPAVSPMARAELVPFVALEGDTFVRIMQLLKAALFNVCDDLRSIEITLNSYVKERDQAPNKLEFRDRLLTDALVSTAKYCHQPYDTDVAVAEKMIRKLRRLVVVCDAAEGAKLNWILDTIDERGISQEIAVLYEVAMVCLRLRANYRRQREHEAKLRILEQKMMQRGRVLQSLGMYRRSTAAYQGYILPAAEPKQRHAGQDDDEFNSMDDYDDEEE